MKILSLAFLSILLLACFSNGEPNIPWNNDIQYLNYYGIEYQDCQFSGTNLSIEESASIWSWSLKPAECRGRVLYFHGYLDHSALSSDLINFLLSRGMEVIAFDLAGHGRSSGARGGLEDFEEYRRSLDAVINHWEIKPEETYFIGHSTGCSIIFDYLLRGGTCKATLWAAPLVRFRDYDLVHTLISDQGSWNPQLPVSRTPSTSNEQFYQKKWQDPQRISVFEISWARSIIRWNEQLPHSGDIQLEQPVTILQGLRDRVVWYDYNIP
nr:alpha/beta hydrolase [Spirochaetaceae bacterium]